MSKPMTAAQWQAQMKKWSVPVEYWTGWHGRGRPASTGSFSNINGVIIHHTASTDKGTDSYLKFLFQTGRSDLPAPLCHTAGKADGTIVMGATGRANHAGKGSSTVLSKVIAEDYSGELKPGADNTDGNARFYGIEMCYRGVEGYKPTTAAYNSAVRWAAAICDFHDWSAKSVIGHREWTRSKIDPGYINMADFRTAVQALLDAGADSAPTPEPEPQPEPATDSMNPASYFMGANGAHVTWLGQRLVVHGFDEFYNSGPGPRYSEADRLNVAAFQRAQGWSGSDADGYPGAQSLALLAADPKVTVPTPAPTVQRWFKIASGNFAQYNAHGESTYLARRDDWIAEVKDINPDVLAVQEEGFDTLPWLDAAIYEAVGLERVEGGSDGRYIYADPAFPVLGSGVFDLQPRYKDNDKQAAWAALNIGGHYALVTSFHLEYRNPSDSTLRVGQMKSGITQAAAQATRHSVPRENIFHCGDTNSDSWVTAKAAIPAGFVDVFKVALEVGDDDLRSFNGWKPTKEGERIDYIYAHKDGPVLAAGQRLNHKAADHNIQAAVIGIST